MWLAQASWLKSLGQFANMHDIVSLNLNYAFEQSEAHDVVSNESAKSRLRAIEVENLEITRRRACLNTSYA